MRSVRVLFALLALSLGLSFTPVSFATAADICAANFGAQARSSSQLYSRTAEPHALPIRTSEGKIVKLSADNPLFDDRGQPRPEASSVLSVVETRTARDQTVVDNRLTRVLARFGMGFKKKDGTPFDVKVNGIPAVVKQQDFDKFVKGMAPVLEKMRDILQVFMSNPNASPSEYGLGHLSPADIQYIIDEMKASPYYEPTAVNPALRNYKFGSVYGVDATFGNMDQHVPHIFEINAGTPSGLSNQTMIFEALRTTDPEMFAAVTPNLLENKAFTKLRDTMDRHGLEKIPQGSLSVVIGTGVYNGAHPDIAMISYMSQGMPLVARSDLFIDVDGYVRLANKVEMKSGRYDVGYKSFPHVGRKEYLGYPQVGAQYSRSEEGNTLQEDTRDGRPGIGFRIPSLVEVNQNLNRSLGLSLIPGVAYDYIRDPQTNEITDVKRDLDGRPLVESSWDQFAVDPILFAKNPDAALQKPRSLLDSIHKNRVYLSNFGTRLIDHKGILSLVTLQVKKEFEARGLNPDDIVSPPRELRTAEERREFFANPRDTVVKVPDESGGAGVAILPTETEANVREVVQNVRNNPLRYVVQKLADFMGLLAPKPNDPDSYGLRAFDGRTFMYVGPEENSTISDPWAVLTRVADDAKLSTNTSQGAQYGWIAVVKDSARNFFARTRSSFPKPQVFVLPKSQRFQLREYMISLSMVAKDNYLENATPEQRAFFLENFWVAAKTTMSILGPEYAPIIEAIDLLKRNVITVRDFTRQAATLQQKLDRDQKLSPVVRAEIAKFNGLSSQQIESTSGRPEFEEKRRSEVDVADLILNHVSLKYEPTPKVLSFSNWNGSFMETVLLGTIERTTDATINGFIAEVKAMGGEIRYVRQRVSGGAFDASSPSAHFALTEDGRPYIQIDIGQSQFLSGLSHEMVHFRDWKKFYDEERAAGLSDLDAAKRALARSVEDIDFQRSGEARALQVEIETEKNTTSVFNRGPKTRPTEFWESIGRYNYISRVLYPDITAIRRHLHVMRWEKPDPTAADQSAWLVRGHAATEKYFVNAILMASENRTQTVRYLSQIYEKGKGSRDRTIRTTALRAFDRAQAIKKMTLFEWIFREEENNQFANFGILDLTARIFARVEQRLVSEGRLSGIRGYPRFNTNQIAQMSQQQQ